MAVIKSWSVIVLLFSVVSCDAITPAEFTEKVSDKIYHLKDVFFRYEYGGAIIFDGLYLSDETFHTNFTAILDSWLDAQLNDTNSVPYDILHHKFFPNTDAVGDLVGLFPINYLTRLVREENTTVEFNRTAYVQLVMQVANNYVLGWPETLPDGTFTRHHCDNWPGQPDRNASFVWADDQFMGLTLLSRLAVAVNAGHLADFVAKQAVQFSKYLTDPRDGLQFHAYNDATGDHSCCKWSRGNGWGLMALTEVLHAVDNVKVANRSLAKQALSVFQHRCMAMIRYQGANGLWHQVIDHNETFSETSGSSMALYALTRGVLEGWLPRDVTVHKAIMRAWSGLQGVVTDDGTVNGICEGTGIENDVDAYQKRSTDYYASSPGLGSVLYASNYVERYMKFFKV